ncbi:Cyclin-dependent kinase G-2, partial [Dichanthelium oligosanthes]
LKKVKMEKEQEGFPLTSLREINILLSFHHPSIVDVKEVVVGSSLDSIFMVMEYMEHDLKGVMETMKQPYTQSEVKCFFLEYAGELRIFILRRMKGRFLTNTTASLWTELDLKTSNLLLNNRGPQKLLGTKEYSTAIDMWSVGCIMADLLAKEPLFNGKTDFEQLDKV